MASFCLILLLVVPSHLEQGHVLTQQTFSAKGQIVNTLGVAGHMVSVAATLSLWCKSSHGQYVNE